MRSLCLEAIDLDMSEYMGATIWSGRGHGLVLGYTQVEYPSIPGYKQTDSASLILPLKHMVLIVIHRDIRSLGDKFHDNCP